MRRNEITIVTGKYGDLRGLVKNNWALPHNIWIKQNGHIIRWHFIVILCNLFNHLIYFCW